MSLTATTFEHVWAVFFAKRKPRGHLKAYNSIQQHWGFWICVNITKSGTHLWHTRCQLELCCVTISW